MNFRQGMPFTKMSTNKKLQIFKKYKSYSGDKIDNQ